MIRKKIKIGFIFSVFLVNHSLMSFLKLSIKKTESSSQFEPDFFSKKLNLIHKIDVTSRSDFEKFDTKFIIEAISKNDSDKLSKKIEKSRTIPSNQLNSSVDNKPFIKKLLAKLYFVFNGEKIEKSEKLEAKLNNPSAKETKLNNLSVQLSSIFSVPIDSKSKESFNDKESSFNLWMQEFGKAVIGSNPIDEGKLTIGSPLFNKLQFPYVAREVAIAILTDIKELHKVLNLSDSDELLKMSDIDIVKQYQANNIFNELLFPVNLVTFFKEVLENNELPKISEWIKRYDESSDADQESKKSE